MATLKSPSDLAADAVVRAYLHGRTMPAILYGAIVWAVEMRISEGKLPLLDETLANDIDNHAVAALAPRAISIVQPIPPIARAWHSGAVRDSQTIEGM